MERPLFVFSTVLLLNIDPFKIAWNAGKAIIVYKNDPRSFIVGADNPLVAGLCEFHTTSDLLAIAEGFLRKFDCSRSEPQIGLKDRGAQVYEAIGNVSKDMLHEKLFDIFRI